MRRLARPARHEGGLVQQILVILGISALSGVLIAGLALPWVALVDKGVENTASAMQNFALKLKFKPLNERTRVLASDGTPLAVFFNENRKYVPLEEISPKMQRAIVAIEDSRFYTHGALDVKGTLRALLINQASSGVVQGGSSITQQLVKLTLLENADTPEARAAATARSYGRKLEELRYAVWVEDHLSKDEILEHYLNAAYFGDGAYGIEAAAHHYFSTTATKLTLREAALLAGVVKNPTSYDPTNYEQSALDRRNVVLDRMRQLHLITRDRDRQSEKSGLGLEVSNVANGCVNTIAPFFCDYLQQYLLASPALGATNDQRRERLLGGGLTITSTLDVRFQRAADTAVSKRVYPRDKAIGGMAMVEPGTGYVRGLAQSRPMGRNRKLGETYLNFVVPQRYNDSNGFQAGSTFKVFVLAEAIKMGFLLDTKINAPQELKGTSQTDFTTCGGKPLRNDQPYKFQNSTNSGVMDLYAGTQNSVNTFYIQLEMMTGLCGPWRLANQMGVELEDPGHNRVPAFPLGFADVSPLEMAEAYATFPGRGLHCPSTPVLEIRDSDGEVVPFDAPKCNRIMKPAEADAVNDILRGVQEPGGFGYGAGIALNQPSAGKTGTVAPAKSVWFIGYTPTLSTAAMIAGANRGGQPRNLDNQFVGGVNVGEVHGSTTAGPMWYDAMKVVQAWLPNRNFVPLEPSVNSALTTVTIPNLSGSDAQTAALELSQLGFQPKITSVRMNSSAPFGTVAGTAPLAQGVRGQTVLIYLSNGSAPPSIVAPGGATLPAPTGPAATGSAPTLPTPTGPAVTLPAFGAPTPAPSGPTTGASPSPR